MTTHNKPTAENRQQKTENQQRKTTNQQPIITFGEILLRLTPPSFKRIAQTTSFDAHFGGAEANVAAALGAWNQASRLVSKVPANSLGEGAVRFFQSCGINTCSIKRGGERLGIYYYEQGAGLRPSVVEYDRKHSAINDLKEHEFDWYEILLGAAWFHWTGITAALSPSVLSELRTALKAAQNHGVKVSCDLNYRSKLWSKEEARETMTDLMQYVNVLVSNEHDTQICLGVEVEVEVEQSPSTEEYYRSLAKTLKDRFKFDAVALSVRESEIVQIPDVIHRRALLLDSRDCSNGYFSHKHTYRPIEDIGGGDAFTAGLIYGLLHEESSQDALEFAVAAAALKQTVPGDVSMASIEEIRALAVNGKGAKVVR
ncbi:MAG: sugar kinase [Candidatus Kapabacteria bacterium]|jgi:2-dehydro-3-deoxygluconokinase|nr:sugar kinase [Candidatus Kapabacteria bacterium]